MPARILIIEDNPTNLELMTYLLKAFGYETMTASDGEAGLEAARCELPDLIVCDIQIPKIHGLELARRLKNDPALSNIPLVAVTAFAMVGDRDKVMAAGFDGYIAKPIVPQKFVKQLEAFLPRNGRPNVAPPVQASVADKPRGDKRATILVVDDSPVNIALARSILEPRGYQVIAASGVARALEILAETIPDLVLSDVHMGGLSGFDLIRSLKSDVKFSSIPFVFISSTVWQEQDRLHGLELGALRFILRPTDPQVVLSEIEACLGKKETADHRMRSAG